MAKIKNIELKNFRNFASFKTTFDKRINILFGNNGCGKTNILEGISLIAKGRGIRNTNIINLIKKEKENFLIKNILDINNNNFDIEIFCENKNERLKKIIKLNDDQSKDSIDFLNQSISYLIFLPEMERLFQASPSYRRNFIDRLVFSSRNNYNSLINKFRKYLIERTQILQKNTIDNNWLDHIEREICKLGTEIYKIRYYQLNSINENLINLNEDHKFQFNVHLKIKDNFFNIDMLLEEYMMNLKNSRTYDKQYGGTKFGPHKSDIVATINNEFDASLLSTGQQKTVVLMILLAQCNFLVNSKNINPILLFDEIGSHLDTNNRQILLDQQMLNFII